MRILFLDQFSDLGGAQLVLRDILAEAKRRGWHIEWMAPGEGPLFRWCADNAIPTHRLPMGAYSNGRKTAGQALRYPLEMARSARAVQAVSSRMRCNLVVVNGPRIWPAVAAVACPVVFHLHSLLDRKYSRAIARLALLRRPGPVIAVSKSVAGFTPSRVIYNGVADCGYRPNRLRLGGGRIGIVGRISPEKGQLDFVRAARILSSPSMRFTIHGRARADDPDYESAVRLEAAGTPVEFHGWTDKVAEVLHQLDILVVPSADVEATPRVVMEALSAGTPVIAYRSGGIPELLRHDDTGILTERPDAQGLAQAIASLISDPDRMNRLAQSGRREWERRFSLERFQKEICDLLEQTVERRAIESGKPQSASAVA